MYLIVSYLTFSMNRIILQMYGNAKLAIMPTLCICEKTKMSEPGIHVECGKVKSAHSSVPVRSIGLKIIR